MVECSCKKVLSLLFSIISVFTVIVSFAVTYLIFDFSIRAIFGDEKAYPSDIHDLKLNNEKSIFMFFVSVAVFNMILFLLEGAQVGLKFLSKAVPTKRLAYFTLFFGFLAVLTVVITGSVLISDLAEAKESPDRISGGPFESFLDLKRHLEPFLSTKSNPVVLTYNENLRIKSIQEKIHRLQRNRKCCGMKSFREWKELTVPDQTVRFEINETKSLAAVWWENCFRRNFTCAVPTSCCKENKKKKVKSFCSGDAVNETGCKVASVVFLRRFLVALLIMHGAKIFLTFFSSSFTLLAVGKEEYEWDRYNAEVQLKQLIEDITLD